MEFSASYDRAAKIVSTLVCLVLLSLTAADYSDTTAYSLPRSSANPPGMLPSAKTAW